MASFSRESVVVEDGGEPSATDQPQPLQPPGPQNSRPKGRKRILHGLHRMGSSQSLLRLTRSQSAGYRGLGRGSVSCISLNSTSPPPYNFNLNNPDGVHFANGYSTAPTSVPGSPGVATPFAEEAPRVRFVAKDQNGDLIAGPTSIALPSDLKPSVRPSTSVELIDAQQDYFSRVDARQKTIPKRPSFDFWGELPNELKGQVLRQLSPREIVKCSRVSQSWHKMCFDGQLWASLDTGDFYQDIPAESLIKIIIRAGPFARDLNLRGCVQLRERWRSPRLLDACSHLENLSLQDCHIDRGSMHCLLYQNSRLVHVNLSGLNVVTNSTVKILAQQCPNIEHLNVSWCQHLDTKGLRRVIESCDNLRDLRVGQVRGFGDKSFMLELFKRNSLERLVLADCSDLTDDALAALMEGEDPEHDYLTGKALVLPRKLKHLDLSRCRSLTDAGILSLAYNCPELEGLQLSKCQAISDTAIMRLLPTLPILTHLDLEELELLTNATLQELAKSPCRATLQHLSISYCENLGDVGMLPVVKECTQLISLELDNTRISDLVLIEIAASVRNRPGPSVARAGGPVKPVVGLSMVVYDCQNVTWTGIREVLSRNAEVQRPHLTRPGAPASVGRATTLPGPATVESSFVEATRTADAWRHEASASTTRLPQQPQPREIMSTQHDFQSSVTTVVPTHKIPLKVPTTQYPTQIIALKVFYGYQPTVTEHTRRVLRGDFAAAARLERKWAEYMVASEEAGAPGGFGPGGFGLFGRAGLGMGGGILERRRRRRVREAAMMHADEEGESDANGSGGIGRRRRARSGGCTVM